MPDTLTTLIFDPYYYAEKSGARGSEQDLRKHFDEIGRSKGISPGPMFDADWYLNSNRDIAGAGCTPYEHFLKWGLREGRAPNPLFDRDWYKRTSMKSRSRTEPFFHFLTDGRHTDAQPGPFFWPKWYRATAMDRKPGDPYADYLTRGFRDTCAPNPIFDPKYYSGRYMIGQAGQNPLAHFVEALAGDQALSPHPLFDGAYYLEGLVKRGINPVGGAYHHYICAADDVGLPNPHPIFDIGFYRSKRGADCGPLALVDYVRAGPSAQVDPHPLFSKSHYFRNAPDVAASDRDPLVHYVEGGDIEGRLFHPLFDPHHYRNQGPLRGTCLSDYLTIGSAGGKKSAHPNRRTASAARLRH